MKFPNWFTRMPLSVKLAGIALFLIYISALFVLPQIVIPLTVIIVSVASLMRIFIYLVEGR